MTILYSLLMLLFVILVHEFGHFAAAKLVGIGVTEFSIGMGPQLYSVTKNNTLYTLRLLPVGGYVLLEGDDEDSMEEVVDERGKKKIIYKDSDSPTAFRNAQIWKRVVTMSAGVFMNFVFAVILFSVISVRLGVPSTAIGSFTEDSTAAASGLKVGDKVLSIAGYSIQVWDDIPASLSKVFDMDTVDILIDREGEKLHYQVPLNMKGERPVIGIYPKYVRGSVGQSLSDGWATMKMYAKMLLGFLDDVIHGKAGVSSLSGPVGVVKEIGKAAKSGLNDLLTFMAYINLNLGIFNLLPIPAFDGSKILFLFVEAIRGKVLNRKVETAILSVGIVFIIGLMLVVTYRDILSLFR